jgi:RNA polymerase sigma-70 factor (ECF subfamily)
VNEPARPTASTDHELLAAHVAGDPAAFAELFAGHRDRLWAVALRTMGNPEDAADALQDGLISAFRRAGTFRGEAAVTTWLHRVVVNACLDRLRAMSVRRTVALPEGPAGTVADRPLPPAAADAADPALAAERTELREVLLAALGELPAEQRAALVLVDMEGLPLAEAAAVLEVPVGTLKSRCSRSRAKLAVILRAAGVLSPGATVPAERNQVPPASVSPTKPPARAPPD